VLAHSGEGAGVFLAEHLLDPPDEVRLFEEGASGDYESALKIPGLLF
jgi:hypothetical protein